MLTTKVQVASLNGRGEKEVLSLMRHASPARFDYTMVKNERLTRYSSNETGVIKAQIQADKIEEAHNASITAGHYFLLLRENHTTFTLMTVKNWLITRIDILLEEQVKELDFQKKPIFTTETDILKGRTELAPYAIEELTDAESAMSEYWLSDNSNKRNKVISMGLVATVLGVIAVWMVWPDQEVVVPKKAVKQIKTIRLDKYHAYKTAVENGIEYHDIHQSIVAMTLAAFKLPTGWNIDKITLANGLLNAEILNDNGQTQQLKQFRDLDQNSEFISINGQHANYSFPIQNTDWFRWTKQTGDFVAERDGFMDEMIVLGAKVKSNHPESHEVYTEQQMNIFMEEVPLAYLDVFSHAMFDRPIFIEQMTIRPLGRSNGNINIDMTVKIVGR